jgi:riboflavin transporter FmnP
MKGVHSMKKKILANLFRGAKYFSVMGIGAFIAVMVECGICFELIFGVIVALVTAVAYDSAEKKVVTDYEN